MSLTKIKGAIIHDYLIPLLNSKISRDIGNTRKSIEIKVNNEGYLNEASFEEMSYEEKDRARHLFLITLADFLFATKKTIQLIMYPKIFDKVIDGVEYRFIKHRHFIRLIKRIGLSLNYNDEMCIKDIVPSKMKGSVNLTKLEALLVTLGIEDEKPISTKQLDYSKITGPVIRIFNKINHDMNEQNCK